MARSSTEVTPLLEEKRREAQSKASEPAVKNDEASNSFGYTLLLFAAIFFCIMTLITRYLVAYYGFSLASTVFIRGIIQGLVSLITTLLFLDIREVVFVPRQYIPHVLVRALFGTVALCLNYRALSLVPLGIVTCILFFHPILTMLLSSLVLKEKAGVREIIAAALSFCGIILVSNPTLSFDMAAVHSKGYITGVFCVFTSSFILALTIIVIRSAGTNVHYMSYVSCYAVFTALAGLAMGGGDLTELLSDKEGLLIAFIASFCGFLGQLLLNAGFQRAKAGTGSVVRTVDVPLAFVLGLIFLHEVPHMMSVVGSVLVMCGVAIIGLKELVKKRGST